MLRYKSRNMPNAKSRRGPRVRRNHSIGRGIRRGMRLGRGRSFKRDLSISVLSLGRGPSLRKCTSKSSLGRGQILMTYNSNDWYNSKKEEACVKSRLRLTMYLQRIFTKKDFIQPNMFTKTDLITLKQ